jgi:hypothetical protein
MKTSNQLDGANDEVIAKECRKKKPKTIEISLQLDGTGPPVSYLIYYFFLLDLSLLFFLYRLVMMMKMMTVKQKE